MTEEMKGEWEFKAEDFMVRADPSSDDEWIFIETCHSCEKVRFEELAKIANDRLRAERAKAKVFIACVDSDGTLHSSPQPEKVFLNRAAAETYLKTLEGHGWYGVTPSSSIIEMCIEEWK